MADRAQPHRALGIDRGFEVGCQSTHGIEFGGQK
jgi:hypothetical protein